MTDFSKPNKLMSTRVIYSGDLITFLLYPEKAIKASVSPRPEVYVLFFSCRHSDKSSL